MKRYLARLCWNSKHWTRPTGEAALLESGTYVDEMGFGHEEWLFNYEWILDGWKYGFLQPVNKSFGRVAGKTIGVLLYTLGDDKKWFRVAEIEPCEVLTEELAEAG